MGMDQPGGLQANLDQLQSGADQFAGGSRQIADAVNLLVDQVKQLGGGLSEAATFLLSLKHDAAQPAMAGFNIPSQLLHLHGVPGGRQGIHLGGRPLGAVLGANQTQSVQHRSHGPGQRDPCDREGSPTEYRIGGRQDIDGGLHRWPEGHPRLLPARHPVHHRGHPLRRAADLDRAAACDCRAAVSGCLRSRFVSLGGGHRRVGISIHTRPAITLERASAGIRGVGRGGSRLQHAACLANARRVSAQHALRHYPHPEFDRRRDHCGRSDLCCLDVRSVVLQHRHRGPGRFRDRRRHFAGYLLGAHHHGSRHRGAGRAGKLVAVTSRRAAMSAPAAPSHSPVSAHP